MEKSEGNYETNFSTANNNINNINNNNNNNNNTFNNIEESKDLFSIILSLKEKNVNLELELAQKNSLANNTFQNLKDENE